ncbi:Uncharacterised protein [Mycobacterium tuberculosis]|uniref:Uncharacterized protein n=1 Tax=Mycobacterium tuberculosis TaxID=1773 RepID=A0A0T9YUI1_MYCTX|nr:Uncharacterised protein [Mycobacterium tuberculosis]CNW09473.1 Uncharacterised protein [Mycobacterium tuberculosis]COV03745.1 Uncharacterised protein [Mycobacterium tuberculosis]COV18809.1 Uncharacterised protein [Mycobacterium tuberculosis]
MTISHPLRTKSPNTNRKASQPKIRPEAPIWSVGPQLLPTLPISQVPKPPRIQMIAVAQTNRDSPASVIRNPSTSSGMVLAIRWCQFACKSGAKMTPHRPSVFSGLMPLTSSRLPDSWSISSTR